MSCILLKLDFFTVSVLHGTIQAWVTIFFYICFKIQLQ